jgi:hypothetical protein
MKDYEDEAFDELEKSLQRKVATGVTDGSKKDAALRLALEAFEEPKEHIAKHRRLEAIHAIKEALGDA